MTEIEGLRRYRAKPLMVEAKLLTEDFTHHTEKGPLVARAGFYLMRDADGVLYALAPELFEAQYELLVDAPDSVRTDTEVKLEGDMVFSTGTREILRFTPDGKILHEGRVIKNAAKHIYKGLVQWLTNQQHIFPMIGKEIKRLQDENERLTRLLASSAAPVGDLSVPTETGL